MIWILKLLGNNSMSQTNEENLKISELLENFQKFSADEQNELIASFKRTESGELTDEELEGVVGGIGITIKKPDPRFPMGIVSRGS